MNRNDIKLPDEIVEYMRHFSEQEDRVKFQTAGALIEVWDEYGKAVAHHMGISLDSAHRQFIEKLSAQVGIHHSTLYSRARVGRNWVARGYHEKYGEISYGVALELMRNAPSKDGLVCEIELAQRINRWYTEGEEKGSFPGTRTVSNYYKKNGEKLEWEQCWSVIKKNCKELLKIEDTPKLLRDWLTVMPSEQEVLNADADCGGSGNLEK